MEFFIHNNNRKAEFFATHSPKDSVTKDFTSLISSGFACVVKMRLSNKY